MGSSRNVAVFLPHRCEHTLTTRKCLERGVTWNHQSKILVSPSCWFDSWFCLLTRASLCLVRSATADEAGSLFWPFQCRLLLLLLLVKGEFASRFMVLLKYNYIENWVSFQINCCIKTSSAAKRNLWVCPNFCNRRASVFIHSCKCLVSSEDLGFRVHHEYALVVVKRRPYSDYRPVLSEMLL